MSFQSDLKLDTESAFLVWVGIELRNIGAAMEKTRSSLTAECDVGTTGKFLSEVRKLGQGMLL